MEQKMFRIMYWILINPQNVWNDKRDEWVMVYVPSCSKLASDIRKRTHLSRPFAPCDYIAVQVIVAHVQVNQNTTKPSSTRKTLAVHQRKRLIILFKKKNKKNHEWASSLTHWWLVFGDERTTGLKFSLVSKSTVGISLAASDAAAPRRFATSAMRRCWCDRASFGEAAASGE